MPPEDRLGQCGSLFFIDRVDNYAPPGSLIRRLFTRAFNEIKGKHARWKGVDPERVQAAYFAQKRRKGGAVEVQDSVGGQSKEDEAAYDLIMKDKERLLAFEEPVAFIFSHSALREGWDNPNVFQICTLNQTSSEVKKRQEVGRGIRLAVDQQGERSRDERINVLTVVANESYEQYVASLQSQIEEDYGREGLPPPPANARKRRSAKLRKQCILKPEFKALWERIRHKTRFAVRINTADLLKEVLPEIGKAEIRKPQVAVTKAQIQVEREDLFKAIQVSEKKPTVYLAGRHRLPNLVDLMANLMEHTTPPMHLTRRTLLEVFRRAPNRKAAVENPHEFATVAVGIIKRKLADHLVNGVQYQKIGACYEMRQMEASIEGWLDYMVPAERSVYDHVIWESEVERQFVEDLERLDYVKLYLKLPGWFTVDTPVGPYNPDWAIVLEDRDEHGRATGKPLLYLVRETKGENWKTDLRRDEERKTRCGERHFQGALGVSYKVVSKVAELR